MSNKRYGVVVGTNSVPSSWFETKAEAIRVARPNNARIVSQELSELVEESLFPEEPGSVVSGTFDGEQVFFGLVEGAIEDNYWVALSGNSASATIEESEILDMTVSFEPNSSTPLSTPTVLSHRDDVRMDWPDGTVVADKDGDKVERYDGQWVRTRVAGRRYNVAEGSKGDRILEDYLPAQVVVVGVGVNRDRPSAEHRRDWVNNAADNY